jgi:aspartate carbamoyltransferase regulatory subunit
MLVKLKELPQLVDLQLNLLSEKIGKKEIFSLVEISVVIFNLKEVSFFSP